MEDVAFSFSNDLAGMLKFPPVHILKDTFSFSSVLEYSHVLLKINVEGDVDNDKADDNI